MTAKKPPLLPDETLARVLSLATADGRILLVLAGTFALMAAVAQDLTGALIGCLAAGAGALELHGVGLLRGREPRGVGWLVRSQILLLATMVGYAALKLVDTSLVFERLRVTPEITKLLDDVRMTKDQAVALAKRMYVLLYASIGVVSIFYQGGMALFYHRRREAVSRAIEDDNSPLLD